MNAKLGGLSGRDVVRALERAGFVLIRVSGSHHILYRQDDKTRRTVVPVHGRAALKQGTLRGILRQAKLTEAELRALL